MTLAHHGQPEPMAGLESFALGAEQIGAGRPGGRRLLSQVDRVQYRAEGGTSHMTLVKYVGASPSKK